MKKDFQDRIDDYVLGRMSAEERLEFEKEICRDAEKKEQLRFTQNVKSAIDSRQEKLKRMAEMKHSHSISAMASLTGTDDCHPCIQTFAPAPRKKPSLKQISLWASGIAAVLVVGYFIISPLVVDDASMSDDIWRGEDGYIFESDSVMIDDSVDKDIVFRDTAVVTNDVKNSPL
jgi:hypothetical protein